MVTDHLSCNATQKSALVCEVTKRSQRGGVRSFVSSQCSLRRSTDLHNMHEIVAGHICV